MLVRKDAVLLRIVVGLYEHHDKMPLSECLMLKARALNLQSGAVVPTRMAFKSSNSTQAQKSVHRGWDIAIVLELVDTRDRINAFIEASEHLLLEARLTIQEVTSLSQQVSCAA